MFQIEMTSDDELFAVVGEVYLKAAALERRLAKVTGDLAAAEAALSTVREEAENQARKRPARGKGTA